MRDYERDEALGYRRGYGNPSAAAWVAAVSVAFAVFVLGGFIRTYRQLESVRAETKHDIQELRKALDALQNNPAAPDAQARARRTPQVAEPRPAEPASPIVDPALSEAEGRSLPVPGSGLWNEEAAGRREPLFTPSSGLSSFIPAERRKPAEAAPAATPAKQPDAGRIRVIAVNNGQKKIMVEGGRDLGIAEGGRLEMSRSGRWIGDLRVVAVFDNISACEILHSTTSPEPGDLVRMPDRPAS